MKYLISLSIVCLFAFTFITNDSRTIEGTVTDQSGQPIEGASVQIKGTKTGTTTDSTGHFKLAIPVTNAILVVSAVNFSPTTTA